MSDSLIDLIDLQTYEDWQRSIIYEHKRSRDPESDEAINKRQGVIERQNRLADAVNAGWVKAAQYIF